MSEQAETETVYVQVTWSSTHKLRVPVGTGIPATLDELMKLVEVDPESEGDLTTKDAEPVDWTW